MTKQSLLAIGSIIITSAGAYAAALGGCSTSSTGASPTTDAAIAEAGDAGSAAPIGTGPDGWPQFWYPECNDGYEAGVCSTDNYCSSIVAFSAPSACGEYAQIKFGCVGPRGTNGNECYVRKADGRILVAPLAPHTFDGLNTCQGAGLYGSGTGSNGGNGSMPPCLADAGTD